MKAIMQRAVLNCQTLRALARADEKDGEYGDEGRVRYKPMCDVDNRQAILARAGYL
jgi:hypothetical protein